MVMTWAVLTCQQVTGKLKQNGTPFKTNSCYVVIFCGDISDLDC